MTLRELVLKVSDHTTVEVHVQMFGTDFSTSHSAWAYLDEGKNYEDTGALMDKTINKMCVRDNVLVVYLKE